MKQNKKRGYAKKQAPETAVRTLGYTPTSRIINKENLHLLKQMSSTRPISVSNVNNILTLLKRGGHFESTLVVNERGGHLRIIDGNHRKAALEKFFAERPDHPGFEVAFATYKDLTDEQEAQAFDLWNSGKKQSLADFLEVHREEIPIYMKLLIDKDFPVKVRYMANARNKNLAFHHVVRSYLHRNTSRVSMGRTQSEIEAIKALGDKDYARLHDFFEDYVKAFGLPGVNNPYRGTSAISALMKTYFANVDKMGRDEIVKRWRKFHGEAAIIQYLAGGGAAAVKQLTHAMVGVMNKGARTNLCVGPADPIESEQMPKKAHKAA